MERGVAICSTERRQYVRGRFLLLAALAIPVRRTLGSGFPSRRCPLIEHAPF